jgi:hypothetical protein
MKKGELAFILDSNERTYDLIKWYVPILNKFPRDQKYMLGDRIQNTLYSILESLIRARYRREKLEVLGPPGRSWQERPTRRSR